MTVSFDYDLFLSYNKADSVWVQNLAARIEECETEGRNFRVFLDQWNIEPGENVVLALEQALRRSRKVGLVISPDSVVSKWVSLERSAIIALDPAGRERRMLPILLRGDDDEIPAFIAPLKRLDFRDPNQFEENLRLLIMALKDHPVPRNAAKHDGIPRINAGLRQLILSELSHACAICHSKQQIQLVPVDPRSKKGSFGYSDLIPLCDSCSPRVAAEEVPSEKLRSVRDSWREACQGGITPDDRQIEMDKVLSSARRTLLTAGDMWGLVEARLRCQEVLHRYDPFNVEARLLLEQIKAAERNFRAQAHDKDERSYADSLQWISRLGWLAAYLLPCVLLVPALVAILQAGFRRIGVTIPLWWMVGLLTLVVLVVARLRYDLVVLAVVAACAQAMLFHESGHILEVYFRGGIRNALGIKMPLWRYYTFLEVNDMPFWTGVRDAARRGRTKPELPTFSVNWSRMQREWYERVSF